MLTFIFCACRTLLPGLANYAYAYCDKIFDSTSAVCDQKTSKFFVSHIEESIAGHVGVSGVY
jgi:hypothetical protein